MHKCKIHIYLQINPSTICESFLVSMPIICYLTTVHILICISHLGAD